MFIVVSFLATIVVILGQALQSQIVGYVSSASLQPLLCSQPCRLCTDLLVVLRLHLLLTTYPPTFRSLCPKDARSSYDDRYSNTRYYVGLWTGKER